MIFKTHIVSIKPNYLTTYVKVDVTTDHPTRIREWAPLPSSNLQEGIMSNKANKRVRLAIDWLLAITKDKQLTKKGSPVNFNFKVNFITLTLSSKQIHSDNTIKKELLNHFLTVLRSKYGCNNYLWRAESQRNGNIHFHIVSDIFYPYQKLREDWNRIQEKLGYISRYTERTGKTDPNSTDVHSITKIRNLSAYLSKYCSKNSKGYVVMATQAYKGPLKITSFLRYKHPVFKVGANFFRQIHGKLWGLSQTLSKLQSAKIENTGIVEQEMEWLQKKFPSKSKYLERVAIHTHSIADLIARKCNNLVTAFNTYVDEILNPKPKVIEHIPIPILPPPKKQVFKQTNLF